MTDSIQSTEKTIGHTAQNESPRQRSQSTDATCEFDCPPVINFRVPHPVEESLGDCENEETTYIPAFKNAGRHLSRRARTLIVCLDGTGDQFDDDNSNIVRLFGTLLRGDPVRQVVYYQVGNPRHVRLVLINFKPGIGTYTKPSFNNSAMIAIKKILDMMIATDLEMHLMQAYEFLMQTYRAGDKICIFGFSRGAYTARALAAMIHKVGLLPSWNHQQISFAYRMYKRTDAKGWDMSDYFRETFSVSVKIAFVGVWDTVNSVGIVPRRLPFTAFNSSVLVFRHAMSLDERRSKFRVNHFKAPSDDRHHPWHRLRYGKSVPDPGMSNGTSSLKKAVEKIKKDINSDEAKKEQENEKNFEEKYNQGEKDTDILEVWFSGCHADVGGGSVKNEVKNSLSRITLRWMIRQCFLADTGILFNVKQLREIGLNPNHFFPDCQPRKAIPGPDEELKDEHEEHGHDLEDAKTKVHDYLSLSPAWWILEMLPLKRRALNKAGDWCNTYVPNFGRARSIPKPEEERPQVHRSVMLKMEHDPKYKSPRAKLINPQWVD